MNTKRHINSPIPSSYQPTRRQLLTASGMLAAATLATAGGISPLGAAGQSNLTATPTPSAEGESMQLVYGFAAVFTELGLVGMTPRGIRYNLPYAGEVVTGPLEGALVRGTDYLLIRPDGVGVMDVYGVVTTLERTKISYQATGYVHMPEGVEVPLDAIMQPGFVWPDMNLTLHGFSFYETGVPELAWLNRTVLALRGVANPGIGTLSANFYAFTPIAELMSE